MRIAVLILSAAFLALGSPVVAGDATMQRPRAEQPAKLLPLKGATSGNPCAAFGPGFVKVEGSDTCVHVGGTMSIQAGGTASRR